MKAEFEVVLPKLIELKLFNDFKIDNEDDRRIMKLVYDALESKDFNEGDVIIKEGDIGDSFYILRQGSVQVFRNTPSGDSIALANLNESMNVFFGEAALIGNDSRSATVKATTFCHTLKLSGKRFIEICNKEPILGYRTLLVLAKRMKESMTKANNDIATLYEALFREIEGEY